MTQIDFVAVDWGTSSFRAWAIGRDGTIVAEQQGTQGMNSLEPTQFAAVLERALTSMGVSTACPVVACGMVGAAQGWHEVPYVQANTELGLLAKGARRAPGTQRDVFILPGLKQDTPPNVMRGEETQIAGFLQSHLSDSAVLCLPGTHAKWVQIADGRVQNFLTAMTGELFGLISQHSVLRHCMGQGGWDVIAFEAAVHAALTTPEIVATELFEIRADALLVDANAAKARAWLSGLLIGFELAATRKIWEHQTVHLIGASELTQSYARALECAGVIAQRHDATAMTLSGLTAAAALLLGEPA